MGFCLTHHFFLVSQFSRNVFFNVTGIETRLLMLKYLCIHEALRNSSLYYSTLFLFFFFLNPFIFKKKTSCCLHELKEWRMMKVNEETNAAKLKLFEVLENHPTAKKLIKEIKILRMLGLFFAVLFFLI